MCLCFCCCRACNSVFTALEQCQEAVEISSEDHVLQVSLHDGRYLSFSNIYNGDYYILRKLLYI